jgi:hypothetical protein
VFVTAKVLGPAVPLADFEHVAILVAVVYLLKEPLKIVV